MNSSEERTSAQKSKAAVSSISTVDTEQDSTEITQSQSELAEVRELLFGEQFRLQQDQLSKLSEYFENKINVLMENHQIAMDNMLSQLKQEKEKTQIAFENLQYVLNQTNSHWMNQLKESLEEINQKNYNASVEIQNNMVDKKHLAKILGSLAAALNSNSESNK